MSSESGISSLLVYDDGVKVQSSFGLIMTHSDIIFNNTTNTIYGNAAGLTNYMGIKVYRALLSQSGTAAPTATVRENTLGGTVAFAYSAVGTYTATLSGAFTANKTFVYITPFMELSSGVMKTANALRTSANVITINTGSADFGAPAFELNDDILSGTELKIEVYP